MRLTKPQLNAISEFCLDVAKGLMLGVFASQNLSHNTSFQDKILSGLSQTALALLFLIFAIIYKQDDR